jgi:hypothetical protein
MTKKRRLDELAQRSSIQLPTMIPMVDHEPGLATVDADVFAGNEACLV